MDYRNTRFQHVQQTLLGLHKAGHTIQRVNFETREVVFIVEMPDMTMNQILTLVRAGQPIEAIKLHRATYGTTLAEAKLVIDKIRAGEVT